MTDDESTHRITLLLGKSAKGDPTAKAQLMEAVHGKLRQMAAPMIRRERANHTLQATALVHEVYIKLFCQPAATPDDAVPPMSYQDRVHFFSVAARQMRRYLVDYARGHNADKRGGDAVRLSLEDWDGAGGADEKELLAVDLALQEMEPLDPRAAQIVEMKYFGGMKNSEIADALGISEAAVRRDTTFALRWLRTKLNQQM